MSDSAKNPNISRKEEILARSRRSRSDEGLEHAQLKGFKLGEYTSAAVSLPLVFFAFFTKELVLFIALGIVIFAYVLGQSFTVYRFTKRKYHLAWVILCTICLVYLIVDFILLIRGGHNPLWLRWWMA